MLAGHIFHRGRSQEVFSEDVTLTSELTVSFVKAMQGNETVNLVGACCKHFVARG